MISHYIVSTKATITTILLLVRAALCEKICNEAQEIILAIIRLEVAAHERGVMIDCEERFHNSRWLIVLVIYKQ